MIKAGFGPGGGLGLPGVFFGDRALDKSITAGINCFPFTQGRCEHPDNLSLFYLLHDDRRYGKFQFS
jgi:hypothetical protein